MEWYEIVACVFGGIVSLLILCLLIALVCFFMVFYSAKRKPLTGDDYAFPPGEEYKPFYPQMLAWMKDIRYRPHEDVSVRSYDGLTLRGKYYEYSPDAPVELLFHGYRGASERDLAGGVERCFALGRSALLIDQRGAGTSDGHVITFGIRERKDCLTWIEFATEKFGKDKPLIIGGISMGAATVLLAAGEALPDNVKCVMADCGYSDAKSIIQKVIRQLHLPVRFFYFFVKLGAKIYGGFDLEEVSPIEAVQKTSKPIIFIHGDVDGFVPCEMSVEMHEACVSQKKLVIIKGADHGLAYPVDRDGYVQALAEFWKDCGYLS